jgi:hypothetical protein
MQIRRETAGWMIYWITVPAGGAEPKLPGRPRVAVGGLRIAELRSNGRGWKTIAAELGVGVETILRAARRSESRVQKTSLKPLVKVPSFNTLFDRFEGSANKCFSITPSTPSRQFPRPFCAGTLPEIRRQSDQAASESSVSLCAF